MKNINRIEDLFEEINETMTKEYGKNEKITSKWKEVKLNIIRVDLQEGKYGKQDDKHAENSTDAKNSKV